MKREAKPCPFYGMPCEYVPMAEEAATLRATNERLRAALEPFAKAADGFDSYKNIANPEEWFAYAGVQWAGESHGAITVGDLRRARAALAEEKKG